MKAMRKNTERLDTVHNLEYDQDNIFFKTAIQDAEFHAFQELIYRRLGIHLTEAKRSLLASRLQKVLRQRNMSSFQEYYDFLLADQSNSALSELADRISTNHTYFYREKEHFDFFMQKVLPEIAERNKKSLNYDLRLWCAGCSSGEEPYTLAMLMLEYFGEHPGNWNTDILATDISSRVLEEAKIGRYASDRLTALPAGLRNKYFSLIADEYWQIKKTVRDKVIYRRFNLMNRDYPFRKPFDIIFCRNVMIYFDEATREDLAEKFNRWLLPGGYLFIGHSETLRWKREKYDYLLPAVYRKRGEA